MDKGDFNSLSESLGKLMEISYAGYTKEQANLLASLELLVTNAAQSKNEDSINQSLVAAEEINNRITTRAGRDVADAYMSGLESMALNYKIDQDISQSIGESEMAMSQLMDQYKTTEMQDILAALHQTAEDYRGNANSSSMGKLNSQIKRAHDIADLAEDFKKYDSKATKWHATPPEHNPEEETIEEYKAKWADAADPSEATSEGEGGFYTGEGIQLMDGDLQSAYNKLARLDIKGATTAFDTAEGNYIKNIWKDNGRALASSLTMANAALTDYYGTKAEDKEKYDTIDTTGLANLDHVLLDQTEENIINQLTRFTKAQDIGSNDGVLGKALYQDGVKGLMQEVEKQMWARSGKSAKYKAKTDYAKILEVVEALNLKGWGTSDTEAKGEHTLAALLEALYQIEDTKLNIRESLNIDFY